MKVSIGMVLRDGPWGGGNQFGRSLASYLRQKGVEVTFDLLEPHLDIILLTEPRSHLQISAYSDRDIMAYLRQKNKDVIVVHRINECDERKGTKGVNQRLMLANKFADHTVFISSWLRDLFQEHGLKTPEYSVILNGANGEIFTSKRYKRWNGTEKLKLVTHHWGGGILKGFDIYDRLDELLSNTEFSNKIDFTFIGNLQKGKRFKHVRHIAALSGMELAQSISRHHVYLTASQNEPAGMHHIEGAMCGLPLLYRESGALPEYCEGFGIPFTAANFEPKLQEMMHTYDQWVGRMEKYPHTAERMCVQYYDLFHDLVHRREEILERRNVRRRRTARLWLMMPETLINRLPWLYRLIG